MFWERLISGVILVILAVVCIGKGGSLLLGVVGLLSMIALFELYRVLGMHKTSLAYIGYFGTVIYELLLFFFDVKSNKIHV